MAVGLAMAQQMMQSGLTAPAAAGKAAAPAATGIPEMLSPGDIANVLKVSEGDVVAILESGELAGKKIGSTWRVKRTSLDEYLSK
jgi:excisionase family DNA binding protein